MLTICHWIIFLAHRQDVLYVRVTSTFDSATYIPANAPPESLCYERNDGTSFLGGNTCMKVK